MGRQAEEIFELENHIHDIITATVICSKLVGGYGRNGILKAV